MNVLFGTPAVELFLTENEANVKKLVQRLSIELRKKLPLKRKLVRLDVVNVHVLRRCTSRRSHDPDPDEALSETQLTGK